MNKLEILKKKLNAKGFEYEVGHDEPGKRYPPHTHPEEDHFYTLGGSVEVRLGDGEWVELKQGSHLRIPGGTKHEARVGGEGWDWLIAWPEANVA